MRDRERERTSERERASERETDRETDKDRQTDRQNACTSCSRPVFIVSTQPENPEFSLLYIPLAPK